MDARSYIYASYLIVISASPCSESRMATLNVVFSLAVLLLSGSYADGIPLADLYPFGLSEGDSTLIPNDDGSSSTIALSLPFPFFAVDH